MKNDFAVMMNISLNSIPKVCLNPVRNSIKEELMIKYQKLV